MPKKTKHPRFRTHVRKGENGQRWVSYWYDMRPDPDVSLGTDYEEALKKWREIRDHKPRIAGTIMEAMEAWETSALPLYEVVETRKSYGRQLGKIKPVFGPATWDQIGMPELVGYLEKRTAKTQGNRELAVLSIIWNFARKKGYTRLPWPAAGMERSKWKNKEQAREFVVTDALFDAVWKSADPTLRDAMDLASATGLRLTDCRTVLVPQAEGMPIKANKTGKAATFEVDGSPVLTRLVQARKALSVSSLTLLVGPTGRPLSARMLRDRWDEAREKAASKPENAAIADELRAMYLRDMRKRASDLAGSLSEASALLQHSSEAVTAKHYRSRPTKLRPVR